MEPRSINQKDSITVHFLHRLAVLMVLAGAGGSIGFTLYSGRNNESLVLILLFAGWVVSPFIALLLFNVVTRQWPVFNRLILYLHMVVITLGSMLFYSGLWGVPNAKPAFVFLMIPLLSWMMTGIILLALKLSPSR